MTRTKKVYPCTVQWNALNWSDYLTMTDTKTMTKKKIRMSTTTKKTKGSAMETRYTLTERFIWFKTRFLGQAVRSNQSES